MKTSELTGAALDWAVAKCEGKPSWMMGFSTEWEKGGPIIEREAIELAYRVGVHWIATRVEGSAVCEAWGPTQLVAAMRCYVASKLGGEVELPSTLNP